MSKIWNTLKALHRDEQGADMVEYILIVAAVALPLMGVIWWFWKDISAYGGRLWENVKGGGDAGTDPSTLGH